MKAKHLISSMFALMAILLTSCTDKETVAGTEANDTKTVTFNVTTDAQAQTRTAPSVTGYKLNYVLQVLDASGNPVTEAAQNNQTGTFTVSLPIGATYTCLFWADFIPDSGSSATDNEYFTTTDLKAVALKQALTGEDQCQAFCGTASIAADQAEATTAVTLKRAVAQVNLRSDAEMKGYSKLEANYTNVPNTFNVLTNETSVSGATGVAPNFTVDDLSVATGANSFTFQSAYFLAPGTEGANMVKIELKTYNSANPSTPLETLTIANVPTKKNYKTNVTGTFKSAITAHSYTIDFGEWGTDTSISVWDGRAATPSSTSAFSSGAGTQGDPYIIGKAADLAQLAADVNAGTDYAGKYFKQTIDINLNGHAWTPIGTFANFNGMGNHPFEGNFDGDKHQITGLYVNGAYNVAGLFGLILGNYVSNLHVTGNVTNTNSSFCDTGGIIGATAEYPVSTDMKISNCSFKGTVTGGNYNNSHAGGICGSAGMCNISCCANYGTITGTGIVGGITSYMYQVTIACYNSGTITGTGMVGGIIGSLTGSDGAVIGCYNTGTIADSSSSAKLGAIAGTEEGKRSGATVSDCYVTVKYAVANTDEKVFSGSAGGWPDGTSTSGNPWHVDAAPDGTYTLNVSSYDNCKFWKSIGEWDTDINTSTYPKLWWE